MLHGHAPVTTLPGTCIAYRGPKNAKIATFVFSLIFYAQNHPWGVMELL